MKIVSLLPSATEIVCQLGLEKYLAGISHECDYPESITHLPRLTSSRINPRGKSDEIHQSVERLLKETVSVYDLDLDQLKALKPDYLITQDLCDVCAVSFKQVEKASEYFFGTDLAIISLQPNKLNDVWDDIHKVAKLLDADKAFQTFKHDVDQRLRFIHENLKAIKAERKSVLTLEWINPVMLGGMWIPEMIIIAGGTSLMAESGKPALTVDKNTLASINPDVVVVKPCGFKLEQTLSELETLKNMVPWKSWKAYQDNNVFLVDGNSYFNRPGPRIIDSLEILAYCIHPNLFPEFADIYHGGFIQLGPQLKTEVN